MRILVWGTPGAGKTTLGRWLAARGWEHLEWDEREKEGWRQAVEKGDAGTFDALTELQLSGNSGQLVWTWGVRVVPVMLTWAQWWRERHGFRAIWLQADRALAQEVARGRGRAGRELLELHEREAAAHDWHSAVDLVVNVTEGGRRLSAGEVVERCGHNAKMIQAF